jgi:hypothetical protein
MRLLVTVVVGIAGNTMILGPGAKGKQENATAEVIQQ